MSVLQFPIVYSLFDTAEARYEKAKRNVSEFTVAQFGWFLFTLSTLLFFLYLMIVQFQ